MSCPNILKFSTFLAHQRPQDAQVRPLHHARVAREKAQRPATEPAAHIGLLAWAHGGAGPARDWQSGRGARPLLPRREAATTSEPPGPNSSRNPEKLTPGAGAGSAQLWGEERQIRGCRRAEIGQEKKPPSGLAPLTLSKLRTQLQTLQRT